MVGQAKNILDTARLNGKKLVLPNDIVCSEEIYDTNRNNPVSVREIPENQMGLDIGSKTIEKYLEILDSAKTVLWNGPMGVYENESFAIGTKAIAKKLVEISDYNSTVIAGGGDTASALRHFGLVDRVTHVSTGGGACLDLLAGRTLPGLASLKESAEQLRFSISKPLDHQ